MFKYEHREKTTSCSKVELVMTDESVIELSQATDLEVRTLLASILNEYRRRKIDISLTRTLIGEDFELVVSVTDDRKEVYVKWLQEIEEYDDLEEEDFDLSDEDVDYSTQDEDDEIYDDDDWIYDEPLSERTPNDDRSDSMNPNSHRYNPGR
ncbi:MAG: hypothetical protein CMB20_002875 [Methanobacteriota archaeon]|nr:MAG: hypothetical protein CMB20_002875 [Euryarchaeota archaeon]|tara:strand:- start:340 stop:795 length:456 start_codon:yes stop_codon:yes gene_type:complete